MACMFDACYDCRAMLPSSEENCSAEDIQFVAIEAARAAGNVLLDYARSGFRIEHKKPINLVTDADHAAEQCVIDYIRAEFPTHRILAEERGAVPQQTSRYQWIIDPLDGTTNFAHGFPVYAVSIGVECDDRGLIGVVYDASRSELFTARAGKGTSLNGSSITVSTIEQLSGVHYWLPALRMIFVTHCQQFESLCTVCPSRLRDCAGPEARH